MVCIGTVCAISFSCYRESHHEPEGLLSLGYHAQLLMALAFGHTHTHIYVRPYATRGATVWWLTQLPSTTASW